MRFAALILTLFALAIPKNADAQGIRQPIQCGNVVECAEVMVSLTNRLIAENAALNKRLSEVERQLKRGGQDQGFAMRKGAARVQGSGNGYSETTIRFNPPFRQPPSVFLSVRDVNIRDHQQVWIKSISTDRAVISNCRRYDNPEGCMRYADDFYFDWIAVRR